VAEFVQRHLTPGGVALISDANRGTADDFPTVARHCALRVETRSAELHAEGSPIRGRLFELRHA
jgi:hypothetical protein